VRIVLNGNKLYWSGQPTWKLNSTGSDNVQDGSDLVAIKEGFQSWERVEGTDLDFQHQGLTTSQHFQGSDHLVMFDENNNTGWFPSGSGIVAITPITYSLSDGRILDADILFNGRDWSFATDGRMGAFDIQDVATHEIGHFIGLDHSPVLGSSMWPYVSSGQWLHRGLTNDDKAGAIAVKPSGTDGRLKGTVRHQSGSVLKGALVGAVRISDGQLVATAMSTSSGNWTIRGLTGGDYHVYAAPVEGGMSAANFTSDSPVQTDFAANFFGGYATPTSFSVTAGQSTDIGAWNLPSDSSLRDSTNASTLFVPGQSRSASIWGQGLGGGTTQVWSLSPWITVESVSGGATWLQAMISVHPSCPIGSYDLYLETAEGEFEIATGVVDVVAPAPIIHSLDQVSGSIDGGETFKIHGEHFQEDAYVLFGGREASVQLLDAQTLEVTTPSGGAGTVTVSVHNPDGRQARMASAFTFLAIPVFQQLFPIAGQRDGGTSVLINGSGFASDMQVLLGGQSVSVEWISDHLVRVATPGSSLNGPVDLVLRNPLAEDVLEDDAFTYVPFADPAITGFTPSRGTGSGGVQVRLFGHNLVGADNVRFGVDSVTAQGGADGTNLAEHEDGSLEVTSPSWNPGTYGLKVTFPNGQGVIAPASFLFEGRAASFGGGCGGVVGNHQKVVGWGDLPVWLALVVGFHLFRRRSSRAAIA